MATTVTYKGQTLTTVNNQTRTLETSGTWLEDDITLVDVTSGGSAGAGEYTLENISPSQSITTSGTVSSYATGGMISSYTEHIQEGEWYLVTYDGDEYVLQCYLANTGELVLGDVRVATTNTTLTYLSTPFIVEYNSTVPVYFLATRNTNTHTLKIDKFVWIAGGTTVGTKTITTNGTYDPSDDNLDLYSGVTVNVPSGGSTLTTKTITSNGTYNASSDNADGYSSVTVNVSGGGLNTKTGSVSFSSTYNTTQNVEIVSLSTIGFTPSQFFLIIDDISKVSGIQYAVLRASFETGNDGTTYRVTMRYSNTSNSRGVTHNASSWTSNNNYMLYNDGTKIYFRTTNQYIIRTGTKYNWLAIE